MRSFALAAVLAASAATGIAAPAFAQDAAAPFTGPRVEGLIGWDRLQNDGGHKDGVQYGVGVGYDMQMGGAVVGAEAEFGDSSTKTCVGAETIASPELCAKGGRDIYVGGRVGTVVGGSTLVYGKAGYVNGRVKLTEDDGSGDVTLAGRNLDGVRVGAGVEHAVGPNSFVKAEYRYSNYADGLSRNQVVGGFGFRF